jgi:1-acyl-sn-glycerol-3-phosphate acyltransferase
MPIFEWFYRYYFRVETGGWHHIPPQDPVLFVGSHNGGLAAPDIPMFLYDWIERFGYDRPLYGLTHPKVWQFSPYLGQLAAQAGAIQAHPKMAIRALQNQANVLVYPGGPQDVFRPHALRDRIHLHNRKGFIKLALGQRVPIVPLISWGAHDTLFVLADFYDQARWLHDRGMPWLLNIDPEVFPLYWGLPWGLTLGPFFNFPLPAQIHTRVCAPIWFERYGREALADWAYVDDCYDRVVTEMQGALDQLGAEVG